VIETLVSAEFIVLMIVPFFSLVSAIYLARLIRDAITPPVLLVLLTVEATVSLLCSSYIAVLTLNTRFFGHANPPELLPVTLLALIAPLAMINLIAFVLWRSRNGHNPRG